MLFDSFNYWLFFGLTIVVLAALADRAARIGLVLFSFVFYSFWNPWFTLLLGGSILANFLFGLWIDQAAESRRRTALIAAIIFNLSLLSFFKYYGFLVGALGQLFRFDPHSILLHIILPVGISFITFEGIAYAVDVYRRDTPAVRNLTNFAVFMSFFPHLVAGPIIRPAHFFPQLATRKPLSNPDVKWGVLQISKGLVKKIVFADFFGPIANAYFSHGTYNNQTVPAVCGVLAFSLQIYFDFAGYTDIARGCARLLGYEFPPNFERPYLSENITDFWRRWHISLSSWLRDYLYIPLGGNRNGLARTYINIIIVMTLGGLWHGASWNFALWGLFHGSLLLLHRLWINSTKGWIGPRWQTNWFIRSGAVILTFALVSIGWIPFRAADFPSTLKTLTELGSGDILQFLRSTPAFLVLALIPLTYCLGDSRRKIENWLSNRATLFTVAIVTTLLLIIVTLFGQFGLQVPFIYFQF